jgi:hypothetical protein
MEYARSHASEQETPNEARPVRSDGDEIGVQLVDVLRRGGG